MNKKEKAKLADVAASYYYNPSDVLQYDFAIKLLESFPEIKEDFDLVKDHYATKRVTANIDSICYEEMVQDNRRDVSVEIVQIDLDILFQIVDLWSFSNFVSMAKFVDDGLDVKDILLSDDFSEIIEIENKGEPTFAALLRVISKLKGRYE